MRSQSIGIHESYEERARLTVATQIPVPNPPNGQQGASLSIPKMHKLLEKAIHTSDPILLRSIILSRKMLSPQGKREFTYHILFTNPPYATAPSINSALLHFVKEGNIECLTVIFNLVKPQYFQFNELCEAILDSLFCNEIIDLVLTCKYSKDFLFYLFQYSHTQTAKGRLLADYLIRSKKIFQSKDFESVVFKLAPNYMLPFLEMVLDVHESLANLNTPEGEKCLEAIQEILTRTISMAKPDYSDFCRSIFEKIGNSSFGKNRIRTLLAATNSNLADLLTPLNYLAPDEVFSSPLASSRLDLLLWSAADQKCYEIVKSLIKCVYSNSFLSETGPQLSRESLERADIYFSASLEPDREIYLKYIQELMEKRD